MAEKTTVVIVNWNGAGYLAPLLRSLRKEKPAEIIVVDNASADASAEVLRSQPQVRTIWNPENVGFGVAANQGIGICRTPYLLLLNVDVEAIAGCVNTLELFLDQNPKAAVVAPQLLFPDGTIQPSCRNFPSILNYSLFLSYLDHLIPAGYRIGKNRHNRIMEVDQPMGAALMIRKNVLDEVGLFDPQFFLYMEEIDLCERIIKQGWKIFYLPDAKMIHVAGGSTHQDWERSQQDYFQSILRYFRKRNSRWKLLLLRCSLALALLLRSAVLLGCGRFRQSKFYLRMSPHILYL